MNYLLFKYLITAGLIVAISEIAKRSDRFGALLTALPLISVLTLIWLHIEKQSSAKIGSYALYTFWYVVPTLPLFLIFPPLQQRLGFWWALTAGSALTVLIFLLFALFLRRFAIELL